jgi:hypothetical protein
MSSAEQSADTPRLPFSIPGTYQGFTEVARLATFDGDGVTPVWWTGRRYATAVGRWCLLSSSAGLR